MADGLKLSIQIKGLAELRARFAKLRTAISTKRELHRRYGLQALNWIDDNFRQEGKLSGAPWAKLSLNTIAAKRSSAILQDKGQLRQSFTAVPSTQDVRVGTDKFYAPFHEEGGKKWYIIRPRRAKALAFSVQRGTAGASRVSASFSSTTTRKTYRKGQTLAFAMEVRHPPLIKRKMLPTQTSQSLIAKLYKVTIQLMKEVGPEIK
jgi:phage gpG-like protein